MSFPGHELRSRRVELGISREAASADCAIPLTALDALESGSIDRLPAPCFTAGFIQSYCRLLGLESEYYLGAYRVARSGGAQPLPHRTSQIGRWILRMTPVRPPRLSSEFQAWAIIICLTLLGWAAYTVIVRPAGEHAAPQAEAATIDLRLPQSLGGR